MILVVMLGACGAGGAENISDFGRISHELGPVSDLEKAVMTFKGIQCPKSVGRFGAENILNFSRISHELGHSSDMEKTTMTSKGIQCPKSVGPFGAENMSDFSPISHELARIKFCSAVSRCKDMVSALTSSYISQHSG